METKASAQFHPALRYAVGTAAAFAVSEAMGWYPTFLAPLFAGLLLGSLPTALSPKAGIAAVVVLAGSTYAAFAIATSLQQAPMVEFGVAGLVIFLCFAAIARGAPLGPIVLIVISFSTIPVVAMVIPQQAGALPLAFTRAMAAAVVISWIMHAIWPKVALASAPPAPLRFASPLAIAVAGAAIVLPMMLVFQMYGITDALAILMTTVVLVINFDPQRGAAVATARVSGVFAGGVIAIVCYKLLEIAPNLLTLFLIALLIGSIFAPLVLRGGARGAFAQNTFNQAIVMFSLALIPGGADTGLWMTRLFQFSAASVFAIGMMMLLLPRERAGSGLAA